MSGCGAPEPTETAVPTPSPTPLPAGTVRDLEGVPFVYVPPGCFEMGSAEWEEAQPVHEACFERGFWIGQTEVTNAQYRECVEAGACEEPGKGAKCHYHDGASHDEHPVNCVDWYQAGAYAVWLGARLPTESEWEYAARGPEGRAFPWGDEDVTCDLANYLECAGSDTMPVGSHPDGASWVGALDMAGNVWEWSATKWREDYRADEDNADTDAGRVVRGGSCFHREQYARSAHRAWHYPTARAYYYGFRMAALDAAMR
jgi:formylglycine-generating enzyme required for sulfatase activity